jgi:hypothetical protein
VSGNVGSCQQTITVVDTTPPTLQGVPGDLTGLSSVECDSVPAPAAVTATDACDAAPAVVLEETRVDECEDQYILTRTWTATDACGNSSVASQVIEVTDSTTPVITLCPADTTIECDVDPIPANTGGEATGTDN